MGDNDVRYADEEMPYDDLVSWLANRWGTPEDAVRKGIAEGSRCVGDGHSWRIEQVDPSDNSVRVRRLRDIVCYDLHPSITTKTDEAGNVTGHGLVLRVEKLHLGEAATVGKADGTNARGHELPGGTSVGHGGYKGDHWKHPDEYKD